MGIVLPTSKVAPESLSPKNLIIFSKPKTGKTSLLAELPDCLILDLEGGSKYLNAMKVEANSFEEAKRQAVSSTLLELKRTELEALAAEVKGPYQNWGTFAVFASSNLSKKSFKKA